LNSRPRRSREGRRAGGNVVGEHDPAMCPERKANMPALREPRDASVISYTMSRIRSKDTTPEVTLRRALWAESLRYRKHYKRVPGSPDIAFVRQKVAVFCDGDFWHGRDWELRKARITTPNRDYWVRKIERNMERDAQVDKDLAALGWTVVRIWEHEIKEDLSGCVSRVRKALGII
jgi:DNA mismatch endonuclease, patch repair protein